jgi:hypothetical protein
MRRGNGSCGHYFTLCVKDNMLFVQNDNRNMILKLPSLKGTSTPSPDKQSADLDFFGEEQSIQAKLIQFMEKEKVYPINIGFEVTEKIQISTT